MDFGNAIRELKNGKSLYRKGWNGKGNCIRLMNASDSLDMTQDFIYIDTTNLETDNSDAPKSRVPWLASQTDLLANDWEVFNDAPVQETSDGKIIFNDINGVRREEVAEKLISVEIERDDDDETDYKVRFVDIIGCKHYHISKETYEAFIKTIRKPWQLDA